MRPGYSWPAFFACLFGAVILGGALFGFLNWNPYLGASLGSGLWTLWMTYRVARCR